MKEDALNDGDLYKTLGVSKDASLAEIQKAYRKLALKYHPDKNPGDESAAAQFKRVSEAYEILSDPEKRRTYDTRGMGGVHASGFRGFDSNEEIFSHFGDIFGDLFGSRVRPQAGPQRGRDVRFVLPVEFELAAIGGKREIEVPVLDECPDCRGVGTVGGTAPERCHQCNGTGNISRRGQQQGGFFSISSACPACHGTGRASGPLCATCGGEGRIQKTRRLQVNIPAGIDNGQVLRLAGQGESGRGGGPQGDLLFEIQVQPHAVFKRDGKNIRSDVKVPLGLALLGGKVEVSTIKGRVDLTIPPGTSSDQVLRIRGQGAGGVATAGDHLVRVVITVPKHLSEEAASAVRQYLT